VPKNVIAQIKLQVPGGQVTPAPPVGPALGQCGVPPGAAVRQLNERTAHYNGKIVGVVITVYADKSFEILVRKSPASVLLKEAAEVAKGSGTPNRETVGTVTADQVRQIAETKFKDLNAYDLDQAAKIIAGTARSMGIKVEG